MNWYATVISHKGFKTSLHLIGDRNCLTTQLNLRGYTVQAMVPFVYIQK